MNYPENPLWDRLVAFIIDLIVIRFLLFPLNYILFQIVLYFGLLPVFKPIVIIFDLLVFWLYFAGSESYECGTTFGKKIRHIQVLSEDGSEITFRVASIRLAAKLISILLLGLPFLLAYNEKNQPWHDRVAKTYVASTKR